MSTDQLFSKWGQIVAKAWQDDAFKKRLVANPSAVLKEQGLDIPASVQVRVVENTDRVIHLTIPAKPLEGELNENDLDAVAGGTKIEVGRPAIRVVAKPTGDDRTPSQQAAAAALAGMIGSLPQDGGPRPN